MKNILFLEQFSAISGGQVVLLQILDSLDKKEYKSFVILPGEGPLVEELDKRGIEHRVFPIGVYSVSKKSLFDMVKYFLLSLLLVPMTIIFLRRNKIDLVYANAPRTYFWGSAAACVARRPIIWHVHSILSGSELLLSRLVMRYLNVRRAIAISKAVAKPFVERDQSLRGNFIVVYNGVDYKKYAVGADVVVKYKKDLNIPADYKVISYIGQLARWKGVDDFLKAAVQLLRKKSDLRFQVIGETVYGGKYEREYEKKLKSIAAQKGQIQFLGRRSDIPELLSVTDILVVPSIEPEPLSLAMLEGMAAGKAVIAAGHGGPAEVIENNVTGILYPPGKVDVLADMLKQLLNDPARCRSLGEEARKVVARQYNLERFISKIEKVIGEVI